MADTAEEDITIAVIEMADNMKVESDIKIHNLLATASAKGYTHKEKDHETKDFSHCFFR
jgi:hypothetical protein